LSAATGGITVFILRYALTKKYDVGALCNGILAGARCASLLKFVVESLRLLWLMMWMALWDLK